MAVPALPRVSFARRIGSLAAMAMAMLLLPLAACSGGGGGGSTPTPPSITSFQASTTSPLYGATVTLTGTFAGGTGSVDPGVGAVTSGTGVTTAAITTATTFTLTVSSGSATPATQSVTVTPQTVVVDPISPAAQNVTTGLTQAFTATVNGALNSNVAWSVDGIAGGDATVGTISAAGLYTAGTATGAHTITATAAADGTTHQDATVTVFGAASVTSFGASTTTPLYGATVTLTATFPAGSTGSINNGIGAVTSGAGVTTPAMTATTTYTLTVTNGASQTTTANVTVTPQTVALTAISPATRNLTVGGTQAYATTVSGALVTTVTWSVDSVNGGNASVGTISAAGLYTAGTTAGAHTIKATATANGTTNRTAAVTVFAAPAATSLAASTTSPLHGATVTLTPTFANGTAVIGTTGAGSSDLSASATSGTGVPSPAITSAKTYTLTVTNGASATATQQVTVTPQTVTVANITPNPANLTVGYSTTFSSSVTNATNTTLTWAVDNVTGGNASVGTISNAGLYVAGSTTGAHTIKATAAADGTTNKTATVNVYLAPTITSFSADKVIVAAGGAVNLNGVFSNGTGTVDQSVGTVISGVNKGVTPAANTTYTLTVANPAGTPTATASVRVVAGDLSLVAGAASGIGNVDNATGTSARFFFPISAAYRAGFLYVAEYYNNTIRKVATTAPYGVTTLAGKADYAGSIDATGTDALFNQPSGIAVDGAGNLYVADRSNQKIRKITPAGVVSTLAGTGTGGGTEGDALTQAEFETPMGVAVNAAGTRVAVADTANHTIRLVNTTTGQVSTFAGTFAQSGSDDGIGAAARFNRPQALAMDSAGNIYVADTFNFTVRKVTTGGAVSTIAGTAGVQGIDGTTLGLPVGLATAAEDFTGAATILYIADAANDAIRVLNLANGALDYVTGVQFTSGFADGDTTLATFRYPSGLALGGTNLFVADMLNNALRKIDLTVASPGTPTVTVAGFGTPSGTIDGTGAAARFNSPNGMAVDTNGNAYLADAANNIIRMITPAGVVSTLPGAGLFRDPSDIAVDTLGNVYVCDNLNNAIKVITTAGSVDLVAGSDSPSGTGFSDLGAGLFNNPLGIALGGNGVIYVADSFNHAIRTVTVAGGTTAVATLAGGGTPDLGTPGTPGTFDGTGTAARFNQPWGLAVDTNPNLATFGNIYVADTENHAIRVIQGDVVTTLAGFTGTPGSSDGVGNVARFNHPQHLAIDHVTGDLYVADTYNQAIRRITPNRIVTTLTGVLTQGSIVLGGLPASLGFPQGIAVAPLFTQGGANPGGSLLISVSDAVLASPF